MLGGIYHVLNRGINEDKIFNDRSDYLRFVSNLYRLNNVAGAIRYEGQDLFKDLPPRKPLVDILKWTLMPNHFHLLLHERTEGGVVEFTKRLTNAFTKYSNIKKCRKGYLFQNSSKIISVEAENHFEFLPYYIDLNPIKLAIGDWKEREISDDEKEKALRFLNQYEWSSFQDYIRQPVRLTAKRPYAQIINDKLFYKLYADTDEDAVDVDMKAEEYYRGVLGLLSNQ